MEDPLRNSAACRSLQTDAQEMNTSVPTTQVHSSEKEKSVRGVITSVYFIVNKVWQQNLEYMYSS